MVDEFIEKHNKAEEYIEIRRSIEEFAKILDHDTLEGGKLTLKYKGNKETLHKKAYAEIRNRLLDMLRMEHERINKRLDDLYED